MVDSDLIPQESFLKEDSFGFIKSDEFESLGIAATDIPPGTFPARKHPSRLLSRFGGNAYGFGFYEVYDRLSRNDLKLLQSITPNRPEYVRKYYRQINRIYETMGLLIRFSSLGRPYYLIPIPYVSSSLSSIRNKSDEISKIIQVHRKKYLKETQNIGLLTSSDDLLIPELSLRFKEHHFIVLDSFEKLSVHRHSLDLVVLPRDLHEIVRAGGFSPRTTGRISKNQLDSHAYYLMGKVYNVLKPKGEMFIITGRYPLKPRQEIKVRFHSEKEAKNFVLFSHIFKTERRYGAKRKFFPVSILEFHKFLNPPYVEKQVLDQLLGGRNMRDMSFREIGQLPYLNFPLDEGISYNQEKTWTEVLSVFFNKIFFHPHTPDSVRSDWGKNFSTGRYTPDYMLLYLGEKKPTQITLEDLKREATESSLSGCPLALLADYRDSFDYVVSTLDVLKKIKTANYQGVPELFMARLREPLESRRRRYRALHHVLKLMSKIHSLERVKTYLNPEAIEGNKTPILRHLETLSLFGFPPAELKEIFLIVVGHSTLGRILSGKINERALKPVSDLARTLNPMEALNLLRYCRLLSMAETVASRGMDLTQEELRELFDLYDSMVKVVANRDLDWDRLLDERISAMGGIRAVAIRKMLKMMNQFRFLNHWFELTHKGQMEKEALADYDPQKLSGIEKVITLIETADQFEKVYFREDPLKASAFYRRLLQAEFHGTGRLFQRISSELMFLLLWITVHVVKGEVINFNPLLAQVEPSEWENQFAKLDEEVQAINVNYLDLQALEHFSEQLYADQTSFIVGTGFQLRVNPRNQAVDISYIDMDQNMEALETLSDKVAGKNLSEISIEDLENLERLFGNLEGFFQSHLKLLSHEKTALKLPERQKAWFRKAENLREFVKSTFTRVVFRPEEFFSDLQRLYDHAPSLLHFVLPELMALAPLEFPEQIRSDTSLMEHIFAGARKMQALIHRDRTALQDISLLHKLAQREFGPLDAGIVGLNETQIETLENWAIHLRRNPFLFEGLIMSLVFKDIGLLPELREKYKGDYHPTDHAKAGAYFVEMENFGRRYGKGEKASNYLKLFVEYHNLLHHMIRGEFSFCALQDVVDFKDKDLLDAIFLSSFIIMFAMEKIPIVEDLAATLFQLRTLCHRLIDGKIKLEDHLKGIHFQKGRNYYAVEAYRQGGIPSGVSSSGYLEAFRGKEPKRGAFVKTGGLVDAMERIFRLRGIRHVEFYDLANVMVKVPMKFIYKKRNFSSVGYATYEKEVFEALRIYNSLQRLSQDARNFILERLGADRIRIYGFERVSAFLNYENMIKLLLFPLMAAKRFSAEGRPICLDFLALARIIEKRYETVNDALSRISAENIWASPQSIQRFFVSKEGIVFSADEKKRIFFIRFFDSINIAEKLDRMSVITSLEDLKAYFHTSLRSLRRVPFYTEDYEIETERAFEKRRLQLTDNLLDQAKRQMQQQKDFRDLYDIFQDLMDRALEIGFTEEQKHRLIDLLELRKDQVRRERLEETTQALSRIRNVQELRDTWHMVKGYLIRNRPHLGSEFETLVAKRFDETMAALSKDEKREKEGTKSFLEPRGSVLRLDDGKTENG